MLPLMMRTETTYLVQPLSCLLFILVYLGRSDATVQVSLSRITPIINTEYYVQCVIKMSLMDVERLQNERVTFSRPELQCQVSRWRYCDTVIQTPEDGECGCNFKKSTADGGVEYSFFLYIAEVNQNILGALYTCEVGANKDERQMEIVMFSRRPPNPLYACKDTTVVFDWEFLPNRESIVNNFHVREIAWKSVRNGKSKLGLGVYRRSSHGGQDSFNNEGHFGSKLLQNASVLPQLSLTNLHRFSEIQVVHITVTFHINSTTVGGKRDSARYSHRKLLSERQSDISDIDINAFGTTIVTMATTTTTRITTITPAPINKVLKNTANILIGTTDFIVAEPPNKETTVSLRIYESITGNLVITCQINHMVESGYPLLNLTIQRDGKQLLTRYGITSLHYSTDTHGDVISCGLDGKSLECLKADDPRRKQETKSLKDDLEKITKPNKNIDPYLALYAFESITCILLMLWAISLCLDHVYFIVNKKRILADKEIDEYRRRKSLKQIRRLSKGSKRSGSLKKKQSSVAENVETDNTETDDKQETLESRASIDSTERKSKDFTEKSHSSTTSS